MLIYISLLARNCFIRREIDGQGYSVFNLLGVVKLFSMQLNQFILASAVHDVPFFSTFLSTLVLIKLLDLLLTEGYKMVLAFVVY